MKKIFSLFAAVLFAGSMMAADALEMYTMDATVESSKGTNNQYAKTCDIQVGIIKWNVMGNATYAPWRIGGKSSDPNFDRTVYSKTAFGSALDSIILDLGDGSITINSIKLTHSLNADFSEGKEIEATSKAVKSSIKFAPTGGFPADSYFKITLNFTNTTTSNKFVEFSKLHFWGQKPTDPEITSADAIDFGVVYGKALEASKTIEVKAYNLTENIAAALETGVSFALPAATLDKEGGDFTVNLAASASGSFNDKLTLSANGAKKEVALSAIAVKTEHDGNNADPFVVDEAREIALAHADGATTKDSVSVTGSCLNVIELNDGRLSFSIGAGNDTVLCYRTYDAEGKKTLTKESVKAGDKVVVRGKLQNFKSDDNNIAEVQYGKLISVQQGSATAIENTSVEGKAFKTFENGQLVIIKNGVKYNATGAIVK